MNLSCFTRERSIVVVGNEENSKQLKLQTASPHRRQEDTQVQPINLLDRFNSDDRNQEEEQQYCIALDAI